MREVIGPSIIGGCERRCVDETRLRVAIGLGREEDRAQLTVCRRRLCGIRFARIRLRRLQRVKRLADLDLHRRSHPGEIREIDRQEGRWGAVGTRGNRDRGRHYDSGEEWRAPNFRPAARRHYLPSMRWVDFSFSRQISSTSSVSTTRTCFIVTVQGFV